MPEVSTKEASSVGDHCSCFDEDPPVWLPWLAGLLSSSLGHSVLAGEAGSSSEVCKGKLGFVLLLLALGRVWTQPWFVLGLRSLVHSGARLPVAVLGGGKDQEAPLKDIWGPVGQVLQEGCCLACTNCRGKGVFLALILTSQGLLATYNKSIKQIDGSRLNS